MAAQVKTPGKEQRASWPTSSARLEASAHLGQVKPSWSAKLRRSHRQQQQTGDDNRRRGCAKRPSHTDNRRQQAVNWLPAFSVPVSVSQVAPAFPALKQPTNYPAISLFTYCVRAVECPAFSECWCASAFSSKSSNLTARQVAENTHTHISADTTATASGCAQ